MEKNLSNGKCFLLNPDRPFCLVNMHFIENEEYYESADIAERDVRDEYYNPPAFALHDFNLDGSPELLVFSGSAEYFDSLTYVYRYDNGDVSWYGDLPGILYITYRYGNDPNYTGLFYDWGDEGEYGSEYCWVEGNELITEAVESNVEEYDNTDDKTLYNANKNAKSKLEFVSKTIYKKIGWDGFVGKYDLPN